MFEISVCLSRVLARAGYVFWRISGMSGWWRTAADRLTGVLNSLDCGERSRLLFGGYFASEWKAMASTHEHTGKAALHAKEKKRKRYHGAEGEQLLLTVDAATGALTKLEKIDSRGNHHEISHEETFHLTDEDSLREIEVTLDDAFEAGIASVLGSESGDPDPDGESSSAEDDELRHAMLEEIIGPTIRSRLRRRLVQRLILAKALAH